MPAISSVNEIVTQFRALANSSPVSSVVIVLFLASLAYSTPLPLTAITSLSIGAMYGVVAGFAISLLSSMMAATALFYAGKLGARGWLASKYRVHAETLNRTIKSEKIVTLISVRWIPGIPFFLLNCAFGLTNITFKRFAISSVVGLSIPTLLIVYAGSKLQQLNSFDEILSPSVFLILFLLGISPIALSRAAIFLSKND